MSDICCVCQTNTADTLFKVGVQKVTQSGVSKYYQTATVPVPVCSACKASELSAMKGNAGAALAAMGVCVVLGLVLGAAGGSALAGAFAGLCFGFIPFGIIQAMKKTSKLGEHPSVQEYIKDGYRVTYP